MSIPAIPKDYYGHKTELFLDNLCNQESDNLRDHKQLGGAGTTISISSASIKYLMIYGMIVLGIVLKIGAKNDGDKCNTRGISDEN